VGSKPARGMGVCPRFSVWVKAMLWVDEPIVQSLTKLSKKVHSFGN